MEAIEKYQKLAQKYEHLSVTSVFATELVRNTNKTVDRDFLAIAELPVGESDVVLVKVIEQNEIAYRTVFIIACMAKDSDARNALAQLTGYMKDAECIDGIALSSNIALVYKDEGGQMANQVDDEMDLNSDEGIRHLLDYINNL